jgi:AraC-like DNA-binding protein
LGAKGSIASICNQAGISNKSLIKAFKKHIGMAPLKFAHLQAVNQAIGLLSKEPKQSFTKLAYGLNFYDQAHFTHVFKSITSLTPSEYAAYVVNKQTHLSSPNFISIAG